MGSVKFTEKERCLIKGFFPLSLAHGLDKGL